MNMITLPATYVENQEKTGATANRKIMEPYDSAERRNTKSRRRPMRRKSIRRRRPMKN
jgi:hypothetical protein